MPIKNKIYKLNLKWLQYHDQSHGNRMSKIKLVRIVKTEKHKK